MIPMPTIFAKDAKRIGQPAVKQVGTRPCARRVKPPSISSLRAAPCFVEESNPQTAALTRGLLLEIGAHVDD